MSHRLYPTLLLMILTGLLFLAVNTHAKTIIPREISNDTVLDKTKSPYTTKGNVYVGDHATLYIEPGVELFLPDSARIYIYGNLQMIGTAEEPVRILPDRENGRWGAICFSYSEDTSKIKHAYLQGASFGDNLLYYKGAISGFRSSFVVENVETRDVWQAVYGLECNVIIRNCILDVTKIRYKNVNVVKCNYGTAVLENCQIYCPDKAVKIDAIDFGVLDYGLVKGNTIHGNLSVISSDGIDLDWCRNRVYMQDNFIYNCQDKGISIGAHSYATLEGNIITGCSLGVAIKDSSFAILNNNTIYDTRIGIRCYEKTEGDGGGFAQVINTIIARPGYALYQADYLSGVSFDYCLSDDGKLPGKTNINADPRFVDAENWNFELQSTSPCIDAGDPDSPADPDGSRADIGARWYHHALQSIQWKFENPGWYFLSLPGTTADMRISSLFPGLESPAYIWNHDSYVETDSVEAGQAFWLEVGQSGSFINRLEPLPHVTYPISQPGWHMIGSPGRSSKPLFSPVQHALTPLFAYDPVNQCYSISDSLYPKQGYWIAVYDSCLITSDTTETLNKAAQYLTLTASTQLPPPPPFYRQHPQSRPEHYELQNYPNPFNSSTTIRYALPEDAHIELDVYNLRGTKVKTLLSGKQKAGMHEMEWHGRNTAGEPVCSGLYFIRLQSGTAQKVSRVILLK
jgi:parallel beta-helix repeat protein